MKKLILLAILLAASLAATSQNRVSILGDSYSTFGGSVTPESNLCWYNGPDRRQSVNDVTQLGQTWWHRLLADNGLVLERNNSYSGSTICNTGYNGCDYADRSFIVRAYNLGNPDIILVFGGTNDSWAGAPIGEYVYGDCDSRALYSFRPAFAHLLRLLNTLYPDARIVNITNSELKDEITGSMAEICNHYGVPNILLHDIDKQSGHPSIAGMRAIADQVAEVICKTQE